ncbi:hypothetical protein TorRG33x02_350070 [Trema orientale]|uniref:Uncharacterized protein n=1 Tax=Trema orientale TaxID=63057 RepID=A0A2P5AHS7_TREOI|nr:hypothetical protein TorRG33x02_350070 [Trema orientale]
MSRRPFKEFVSVVYNLGLRSSTTFGLTSLTTHALLVLDEGKEKRVDRLQMAIVPRIRGVRNVKKKQREI